MAILFSTWVKIGGVAGPSLKKNLEDLLANSSSALRVECLKENGAQVLYIRDRNIFGYLWEKLDAYESELRDMRTRARVALEREIRPFIQEEVRPGVESLRLWKKIEQRILDDHSLTEEEPFSYTISDCVLCKGKIVDELASIPDGLSLSQLPQSAFIAGVAFGLDQDQALESDKPMHVGYSSRPMIHWPFAAQHQPPDALQIKQFYLNALHTLAGKNLPTLSSMVITPTLHPLEKDGELSHEHAKGFLMATKEFIKERKSLKKPVSLLISAAKGGWYQELQREMLGIGSSLPTANNNAAQNNQQEVPESPSGFSKTVSEWNDRYASKQEVTKNLDFGNSSDDELLM